MGKLSLSIPFRVAYKFGNEGLRDNGVDEIVFRCPECINRKGSEDRSGHLYVNIKTYKFHCHRCGYSGVISYNEINSNKFYHDDKEHETEDVYKDLINLVSEKNKDNFSLKIPIDKVTSSESATDYLLKRGFTIDQMNYYDMRVGTLIQEFGRIIIPNQVHHKVYTDTYSARSYIGQTPKYHNPSNIKKSEIVFNLHRVRENEPIILVEGALTAVAAGYHAVATLGKTLSISQASQILQKKPSKIYVNYDYGAERESENACKLLNKLNPDVEILEVRMTDDRDAADLSHYEYTECLLRAVKYHPILKNILDLI